MKKVFLVPKMKVRLIKYTNIIATSDTLRASSAAADGSEQLGRGCFDDDWD